MMTRLATILLLGGLAFPAFAGPHGGPKGEDPLERHDPAAREQRMDRMLMRIKEHDPERYERMMQMRETDPQGFREMMHHMAQMSRMGPSPEDPEFKALMQQMGDLMERVHELKQGYHELDQKHQRIRHRELTVTVQELFELKQVLRRAKLAMIQEKMEALEAEIREREANPDQIIDAYVDELLHEEALPL